MHLETLPNQLKISVKAEKFNVFLFYVISKSLYISYVTCVGPDMFPTWIMFCSVLFYQICIIIYVYLMK